MNEARANTTSRWAFDGRNLYKNTWLRAAFRACGLKPAATVKNALLKFVALSGAMRKTAGQSRF